MFYRRKIILALLESQNGSIEKIALQELLFLFGKKLQKPEYDFGRTKDLYLFRGTSQQFHFIGPNPFMVIGTFHPKHQKPDIPGKLF